MSDKKETKIATAKPLIESVNPGVRLALGSVNPEKRSVNPERLSSNPSTPPPPPPAKK